MLVKIGDTKSLLSKGHWSLFKLCNSLSNAGPSPPSESAVTVKQGPTPKVPWSTPMKQFKGQSCFSPSHLHSPITNTGCLGSKSSPTVTQTEGWWWFSGWRTQPVRRTWRNVGWTRRYLLDTWMKMVLIPAVDSLPPDCRTQFHGGKGSSARKAPFAYISSQRGVRQQQGQVRWSLAGRGLAANKVGAATRQSPMQQGASSCWWMMIHRSSAPYSTKSWPVWSWWTGSSSKRVYKKINVYVCSNEEA